LSIFAAACVIIDISTEAWYSCIRVSHIVAEAYVP